MTNGDFLRSLEDDVLAMYIRCPWENGCFMPGASDEDCRNCAADWLREEVQDDE